MTQKIRDNNFRIILLTRDYGKISCWHKTRVCGYDTGDIIETWIERAWNVNNIKHIDQISSLGGKEWKYEGIIGFLECISLLGKSLPESMPHPSIFDDYRHLLTLIQWGRSPQSYHFLLLKIRLLKMLWVLDASATDNSPLLTYIYSNIRTSSIESLIQAKSLDTETIQKLQKTIELSAKDLY